MRYREENPARSQFVNKHATRCERCDTALAPGQGRGRGRRPLRAGGFGGYTYWCVPCVAQAAEDFAQLQRRQESEERFESQVAGAEDGQGSDFSIAWFEAIARGLHGIPDGSEVAVARVRLRSGEERYVVGKQGAILFTLTEAQAKQHLATVRDQGRPRPRSRFKNHFDRYVLRESPPKTLNPKLRRNPEAFAPLIKDYYRLNPALVTARKEILASVNKVVRKDGSSNTFDDVWVIPERSYHGTLGSTIHTHDGLRVLRIAVGRNKGEVFETIIHEAAHAILGKDHVQQGSHGVDFQRVYDRLARAWKFEGSR